jgi:hypothetical protein
LYQHLSFLNLKEAAKVVPNDVVGTVFNMWSSVSPPLASAARNTRAQPTRAFRARVENALTPQVQYHKLAMKLIAAFQLGGPGDRNIVG